MIYVALLRGINVGGNNKIDMKKLKGSFEAAGMTSVITYINSGNVIFEEDGHDKTDLVEIIENVIAQDFSLNIRVVIRSLDEFTTLMEALPVHWRNDREMKSDVLFLWEEIDNENIMCTLVKTRNLIS